MIKIKEPDFNSPLCKDSLIESLYFYRLNFDQKDSKKWALEWIQKNLPDQYERLKDVKEDAFSNRGFVCRMMENGFQFTEKQINELSKFFKSIHVPVKDEEKENQIDVTPSKEIYKELKANSIIFQLEDFVDSVISETTPPEINITTDINQISEAKTWIEKEIIEAESQLTKYQEIIKKFQEVYSRCGGINEVLRKKEFLKKDSMPTTKEINKAVKTIKYKKEDSQLDLKSVNITKIVGAKKAILFNTKYKTCSIFYASNDGTLTLSGSSIHGYDDEKSFRRIIKNPKQFFKLPDVYKAFELEKTTLNKVTSRISNDIMIINASK